MGMKRSGQTNDSDWQYQWHMGIFHLYVRRRSDQSRAYQFGMGRYVIRASMEIGCRAPREEEWE